MGVKVISNVDEFREAVRHVRLHVEASVGSSGDAHTD